MENSDRLADKILQEELRKLNVHLPKARRGLKELLTEESPSVLTVDGKKIVMNPDELRELAKALPEQALERVRLPLVMLRRTELGPGSYVLLGDKMEEFVLSRVLGIFDGGYEDFKREWESTKVFYKPEVSELLRRFHSLVVIGFGMPGDLAR
ncbi:DUF61 family protein [Candidatus Bathyarchaeota archaeon]|nr:MAG: DUF61 family protein [Candidatus Bathyarchaeota archaeon]TMI31009.1 MAG: DUF61 family protein [Candidatus Bathyarchaeota archaeon]